MLKDTTMGLHHYLFVSAIDRLAIYGNPGKSFVCFYFRVQREAHWEQFGVLGDSVKR